MSELVRFFLRFGEFYLLAAVVFSVLGWLLMEALFGTVDDHFTGLTTVRLTVKHSLTPTYVLWLVLRHGIPVLVGLFVFYFFFR